MVTFAEVREIALALPEAEEGTSWGTPAFKVRGKLFARLREEGDVLVVKTPDGFRDILMETAPETYFITPHYAGDGMVLVRLPEIDREDLAERLNAAWRIAAPKRLLAAVDAREAAKGSLAPDPGFG